MRAPNRPQIPAPAALLLAAYCLLAVGTGLATAARGQGAPPSQSESKRVLPYSIVTNDRLGVHVFQEDDLGITARVDSNGFINLNMVDQVHVAGQTLEEAERTIEKAYVAGEFLRNPKVTLTVEELAPREVSVQGYVKNPGRYALTIETATTLVDIISKAGGFQDTAWGTRVKVTRILADGSAHVFEVDVEDVMRGKTKDKDQVQAANMLLVPGDVIYVPERII
jgi:polysaccharide export outer membrane protein